MVKILLEHGAEVTAKILNGRTPFHFAASNGKFSELLNSKSKIEYFNFDPIT